MKQYEFVDYIVDDTRSDKKRLLAFITEFRISLLLGIWRIVFFVMEKIAFLDSSTVRFRTLPLRVRFPLPWLISQVHVQIVEAYLYMFKNNLYVCS